MGRKPKYRCSCGDAELYFKFGRVYTIDEIEIIFHDRISRIRPNVLPGLELENKEGERFKVVLQLALIPKGESDVREVTVSSMQEE